MKQKILLCLLAVFAGLLSLHAQTERALVINAGDFKRITIGQNIEAVLQPAVHRVNQFQVNEEALKEIGVTLSGNSLSITTRANSYRKNKTKLTLYVNGLEELHVESNSTVKTIGRLNTKLIDVYVGGNGVAHLKVNGRINAYPIDDAEIKIVDIPLTKTIGKTF